jgi:hypothetical protein
MLACFGAAIASDTLERGDRLLEEVLELLQSGDYPPERVAALRDYVWSRPKGEPPQEVGGVMVTLAAYCLARGLDMHDAAEAELARIWTKVDAIRAKQAAKPTGSALPIPSAQTDVAALVDWLNAEADKAPDHEAAVYVRAIAATLESQARELAEALLRAEKAEALLEGVSLGEITPPKSTRSDGGKTYEGPRHGWTCFHCGHTFHTLFQAKVHFGEHPEVEPLCLAYEGRVRVMQSDIEDARRERDELRAALEPFSDYVPGLVSDPDLAVSVELNVQPHTMMTLPLGAFQRARAAFHRIPQTEGSKP